MHGSLDKAVTRFLESKFLPKKRFAYLNEIAKRSSPTAITAQGNARIKYYWQGTIVAVTLVAIVFVVVVQYRDVSPAVDVYQRIADEVVVNHMKLKPLEVKSNSMIMVRKFFESLNFQLIKSAWLEGTGWQMIGGRFCTIQGEVAAQLRMQDVKGNVRTLYQAPYDDAFHYDLPSISDDEEPMKLYSHGWTVRLWRERGLLLAMVTQ